MRLAEPIADFSATVAQHLTSDIVIIISQGDFMD
jgi:hypothetical protein